MASQALGDFLSGVGGAPVNRQGLESFVANSQSQNALRSAQTENALLQAQNARDEQDAKGRMEDNLFNALTATGDPHAREHAAVVNNAMAAHYGNFKDSESGFGEMLRNINTQVISNPNADPNARAAADQAVSPGSNPYQAVEGQLVPRFQSTGQTQQPTVFQTPGSTAAEHEKNASANLHQAQADVGGFNPHAAGISALPPEQQAALNQAFADGRLNYRDVNSRNAPIIGSMAVNNPTYNFNRAAADASLSRNATFQQRAMVVDSLPSLIQNVVGLGKKLNYSDLQVVGQAQKWLKGETNDPDLTEFMGARNDTLMKIANVMRGVGMSDKAVEAENEAMHPTLSPVALDGWMRGQMSSITPLMEQQKRASHIGEPGANAPAAGATTPAAATAPQLPSLADIQAEIARRKAAKGGQ